MKQLLSSLLVVTCAGMAGAQDPQTLTFDDEVWTIDAQHAQLVERLGQPALHWHTGFVWLDQRQLGTGELRFDLSLSGMPGYTGVIWHAQSRGDWEKFYFRHHLSGLPDSVQYTPAFDGVTAWQIHADSDFMSVVNHETERWMAVRVVIGEDSADIYMDGELIHHVPDLLRDESGGGIGFWNFGLEDQHSAFIRNVEIINTPNPEIKGRSTGVTHDLPDGLVTEWRVSAPFSEARLATETVADVRAGLADWTTLAVEANGIANLARAARISEGNTVLAEATLTSPSAQTVNLSFGYSDRVVVTLNGERLFAGNNTFLTRDYRYLGTVTRHVAVPLDLQPGDNTLTFALSELVGGWAVTADIQGGDGVELTSH
ncbi:MAG: hypothetical protein AAFX09_11790 [Pseudomonadota bacterium]